MSTVTREVRAYENLSTHLTEHKLVGSANFEKQTGITNSLLGKFKEQPYKSQMTLLGIDRFVNKLAEAQDAFLAVYQVRNEEKRTLNYHTINQERQALNKSYQLLIDYLKLMIKAGEVGPYQDLLKVINYSRKVFAEIVSRRQGRDKKDQKVTEAEN